MTTSNNQLQIQHTRTGFKFIPPKYTLGYLIIVVSITVATSIVILSGNYSYWQGDGEKIIDEKQWYRLVTSQFAVASFLDLSFMLLSFLWMLFTVTQYQNRFSTVYTLYHFWKTNIIIVLSVAGLYWLMFYLTGMKNFIMNVGGIYPYALHMYLKNNLERPSSIVNHWFLPCPINRWVMGYLVSLFSVLLTPETQGCIVVHLHYMYCSFLVLIKYMTGLRCFYFQGPLIPIFFSLFQRLLPSFIKNHYGFCSMGEYYRKQEQKIEEEKKESELAQQVQQIN